MNIFGFKSKECIQHDFSQEKNDKKNLRNYLWSLSRRLASVLRSHIK